MVRLGFLLQGFVARRGTGVHGVCVSEREEAPKYEDALQERFGFSMFRPWQREAIEGLLEGEGRVLAIAPTGGGKSLTYQFPATQLPGTTVVITPLIALMEDQVRSLREKGIKATYLASSLEFSELQDRERALQSGEYEIVYVSPERLANSRAVSSLRALNPPLVAVDEAHCISQWGHDFRPDYLRIGDFLRALNPPRVLACTATATPLVRDEIAERLGIPRDNQILRGFARPNLHLEAETLDSSKARDRAMQSALKEALGAASDPKGAAIVYAATRKNTEKAADKLSKLGYRTAAYHAGMDAGFRASVNRDFAEGKLDVVVATNAFGMGIDRADIRLVVHLQAPGSIEAYYQEVGRAGRDGEPARGLLLSSSADLGLRRRLIERPWEDAPVRPERVKLQWNLFLDLMRYVEAGSCRHDFILRYFGDDDEVLDGCGHCDICEQIANGENPDAPLTDSQVLVVRKALSGVARAKGRVGMRAVAEMLHGSKNAKLERMGLTELSTHGLLKEKSVEWLLSLLRRCLTAGFVQLSSGDFPVVGLTREGHEVMHARELPRMLLPSEKKRSKKGSSGRSGAGIDIPGGPEMDALKRARATLAAAQGVPAYVICSNRTLADMLDKRPTNEEQLLDVYGMGEKRVSDFGASFLAALSKL